MSSPDFLSVTGASWADLFARDSAPKAAVLAAGVALYAVNVYVVTTILPSVVQDIGGLHYYAWNTAIFIVAAIAGSALSPSLEVRAGPRGAYRTALGVFAAGALVCACAPRMEWLLAGRAIQGLGGGLLFALSYSLIRAVFAQPLWTRAMALVSGMWGVATLCGPAIGGIFVQAGGWRNAFWSLLPVCAVLALLASHCLPGRQGKPSCAQAFPLVQVIALMVSVALISVASVVEGSGLRAALLVMGAAIAMTLPPLDKRLPQRLLPEGAYSLRRGIGQIYACMALLVIGLSTEIYVPYFLQIIHGLPALWAGYLTAAMAAGWTIASLSSSSAHGRSADLAIRVGPAVLAAALAALALLLSQKSTAFDGQFLLLCVALVAAGSGIGMGWPHMLARVFSAAPAGQENLASASITTVQLYATALGAALAGLTTNAAGLVEPGGVPGTASAAFWLFSLFSLPAFAAAWVAHRLTRQ